MKLDPHDCVPSAGDGTPASIRALEIRRWAVVHDLVAHPAMALSGYSAWSRYFHAWTSMKAWPNQPRSVRMKASLSKGPTQSSDPMPVPMRPLQFF